jgi:hypothetical protein
MSGIVWRGKPGPGMAGHDKASFGAAGPGMARHGSARHGVTRRALAWRVMPGRGMAGHGKTWGVGMVVAAIAIPGAAHAAGPWTTSNPGGVTWTAPHGCTLVLDLATSDGYPARVDMTQAYELVVAYRNGVEIGRTPDLVDRVARADTYTRVTTPVAAGDVVTVRHSSLAGLNDGTPNSVNVSASFTCPPPPSTTTSSTTTSTVAPTTTVAAPTTTIPTPSSSVPTPDVSVPPSSETTTTTVVVATGTPPVPQEPTPSVPSPPVVSVPRPVASTTVVALPETGPVTEGLTDWAILIGLTGALAAVAALRGRGVAR